MLIYLKNNPAKFYSNPIWNDAALGFFEQRRPQKDDDDDEEEEEEEEEEEQ